MESAKILQEQLKEVASNFIPKIQDPLRALQNRNYQFAVLDHQGKTDTEEEKKLPISLVLVETRQSQCRELEIALESVLGKINAPLTLICGDQNASDTLKIMKSLKLKNYKILQVKTNIQCANDYNELLMSFDFWDKIHHSQKILVFQADSVICQKSNFKINDFEHFDYIGGQWKINRPCGLNIYGGSGGFSLRDRNLSMQALKLFGDVPWQFGEDGFYGFFIDVLGGVVAREAEIDQFCSEKQWNEGCFAIHKLRVNPNDQKLIQSLSLHCPEWLKIKQINQMP